MKYKLIILFIISFFLISCNKEKLYSKRLQQKENMSGEWRVTELSVDNLSDTVMPTFAINDCDIYQDTCFGQWISNNNSSDFIWQFQNKGKEFVLLRQDDADCCDFVTEISEIQCYFYSGTYRVIKAKKKEMIFESTETIGYAGKTVRMVLERVE